MKELFLAASLFFSAPAAAQEAGGLELTYIYENDLYGLRYVEYRMDADGKVDYLRKDEGKVTDSYSIRLDPAGVEELKQLIIGKDFFSMDGLYQWRSAGAGTQTMKISLGGRSKSVSLKEDPLCASAKAFCEILHNFLLKVEAKRDYKIKIGAH